MASLTIIEHSLTGIDSHHAMLAGSLARAALERGWEVQAGTNRRFKGSLGPGIAVVRAFRTTVYEGGSMMPGLDRTGRWSGHVCREERLQRKSRGRTSFPERCRAWIVQRRWNMGVNDFRRGCERLLSPREMGEQDLVLVATASEVELAGLCRFLEEHPWTIAAQWCLLFHFDIFRSKASGGPELPGLLPALRALMGQELKRVPHHRIRFLATTGLLAGQINQLQLLPCQAIDWPVEPKFLSGSLHRPCPPDADRTPADRARPFRIVMPGVVRREKAQQSSVAALLHLLGQNTNSPATCGAREETPGPVELVVQEPRRPWFQRRKLRVRGVRSPVLAGHAQSAATLRSFIHPLPPDEYLALIDSADIGLMMYDREAYQHRRAGVLSELLCRGRPVLVSAGTWMAAELEPHRAEWVRQVRMAAGEIARLDSTGIRFTPGNLPHSGGVMQFDGKGHPLEFSLEPGAGCGGIHISFRWVWGRPGLDWCRCELELDGRPGSVSTVAGPLADDSGVQIFQRIPPDVRSCTVRLSQAWNADCATIQQLRVSLLGTAAREMPLSQVGLAVWQHVELPEAVAEIRRFHQHYEDSARRLASTLRVSHDPGAVLAAIAGDGAAMARQAA